MKVSRRAIALVGASTTIPFLVALGATVPAVGADPSPGQAPTSGAASGLTATQVPVASRVTASKTLSSRVAKPDKKLLARTDRARVSVVVKLDVDSVASYVGGVSGLAATSPSATGRALTGKSTAETRYGQYLAEKEAAFVKRVRAAVPGVRIGRSLRTVYGGVSLRIPASKAKAVQALPGVVAVQRDALAKPLTDSSADFIGAPTLYDELGTTADAGKGLILGNLDSGVWPEHPSFADQGNLPAPPGPTRACDYGDNPLTPANDPFVCNHKLIGGAAFTRGYDSQVGDDPYAGTARDWEGHGTHTSSTSAGNPVSGVSVLGSSLPDVHGIAPGAYVMEYKVCGPQGCLTSDSAAAVGQAILDGVDAINFSISGGADPFTDAAELAFLDAYAANVFVATSAGNAGPTAGTTNHLGPWVTTVAASTQRREFADTLTLTAGDGATFSAEGSSITRGVGPRSVVLGSAAPYGRVQCDAPAAPGSLSGKIVACQRGGGRVTEGYNVLQGGAAGMILYNAAPADALTDNHWLPTTHLADGRSFVAFMNAHPGVTGTISAFDTKDGQGDVMAAFSSRGPGGTTLKPDLTAPGVQILAGHTPTPLGTNEGPPGQYFQAIAGTSMSTPHVAGAALLLRAAHPTWTPGQIRSALMTTATTAVVKEDRTTPADPFDLGGGRIDLTKAGSAALTFDETAERMALMGDDPLTAVDLNLPSVNAPTVSGALRTTRTAVNTTDRRVSFGVKATAPAGTRITVRPARLTLDPGDSATVRIAINTTKAAASQIGRQQFGRVDLTPVAGSDSGPALHLPVAFVPAQGGVTLASRCTPDSVAVGADTTCTVTAQNNSSSDTTVTLRSRASDGLQITSVDGAYLGSTGEARVRNAPLAAPAPGVPSVAPGRSPAGYLPLDQFGISRTPIGDEEFLNMQTPPFLYNGVTYTSVAISSNGFIKAGAATSADQNCCNLPTGPDPAPPNDMIAPFWTDLDGTGAPGILAGVLTDGSNRWFVVEHRVNVFNTTSQRVFETWIGLNGTQDITMVYDPANLPADPGFQRFLVGAENPRGEGSISATPPTTDLRVTSSDPSPGASVTYSMTVRGVSPGAESVTTRLFSPANRGTTVATTPVQVTTAGGG